MVVLILSAQSAQSAERATRSEQVLSMIEQFCHADPKQGQEANSSSTDGTQSPCMDMTTS